MFVKSRTFAVAVATVGVMGFGAPMAHAATAWGGPGGDNGGLVNISHNQVPIQACGNDVPINIIGGQVPVSGVAGALDVLGVGNHNVAVEDKSCHLKNGQDNARYVTPWADDWGPYSAPSDGDNGGLLNISHNQVPIQVCNNFVPVNGIGGQVPLKDIAGALGLASVGGKTIAVQDSSCHLKNHQKN